MRCGAVRYIVTCGVQFSYVILRVVLVQFLRFGEHP